MAHNGVDLELALDALASGIDGYRGGLTPETAAKGHVDADVLRLLVSPDGPLLPSHIAEIAAVASSMTFGAAGVELLKQQQQQQQQPDQQPLGGKLTAAPVRLASTVDVLHLLDDPNFVPRVHARTAKRFAAAEQRKANGSASSPVAAKESSATDETAPDDASLFLAWNAEALCAFVEDVLALC
jgi:hypothetical protein